MTISITEKAELFLRSKNAPDELILHGYAVLKRSRILSENLESFGIDLDRTTIEYGSILHDAGKLVVPEELFAPGSLHEAAGETLLLENGFDPEIARICRSHGAWRTIPCSLEELIVAISDVIWKGSWCFELETLLIDAAAQCSGIDRWEIYRKLIPVLDSIAGDVRSAA